MGVPLEQTIFDYEEHSLAVDLTTYITTKMISLKPSLVKVGVNPNGNYSIIYKDIAPNETYRDENVFVDGSIKEKPSPKYVFDILEQNILDVGWLRSCYRLTMSSSDDTGMKYVTFEKNEEIV